MEVNYDKDEVKELTTLFRTEWQDLQKMANSLSMDINNTFMIAFLETEDCEQFGLLYDCTSKTLIDFSISETGIVNANNVTAVEIRAKYPQVSIIPELANYEHW